MADRPRRPGTNSDHDRFARKDAPALGVPVTFEGPATGVLGGDDLRAVRSRRSPEERLERLEERADRHDEDLAKIGDELAEVAKGLAATAAVVQDRARRSSGSSHAVETAVENTLAKQVLAQERERGKFKHAAVLQIIPGLTAVIVALIALLRGC